MEFNIIRLTIKIEFHLISQRGYMIFFPLLVPDWSNSNNSVRVFFSVITVTWYLINRSNRRKWSKKDSCAYFLAGLRIFLFLHGLVVYIQLKIQPPNTLPVATHAREPNMLSPLSSQYLIYLTMNKITSDGKIRLIEIVVHYFKFYFNLQGIEFIDQCFHQCFPSSFPTIHLNILSPNRRQPAIHPPQLYMKWVLKSFGIVGQVQPSFFHSFECLCIK